MRNPIPTLTQVEFWPFIWRALGRGTSDTAAFFGLDLKTVLTGVGLLALGLVFVWKVRGVGALREEVLSFILLTAAPSILFLTCLLIWHGFRAPYLIYIDEFQGFKKVLDQENMWRQSAEREVENNTETIKQLEKDLAAAKRREPSQAKPAAPLSKPATSSSSPSPQAGLSADQCRVLAALIERLRTAINILVSSRATEAARSDLSGAQEDIRNWLTTTLGPTQAAAFMAADPTPRLPANFPSAFGGLYQIASGRLNFLVQSIVPLCR